MRSQLLAASLLLAGAATAQTTTTVVPISNTAVEGNALEVKPFYSNRIRLTQMLADSVVGVPKGKQITEIAYRRDKTAMPTATMTRRGTPTWSVRLGNLDLSGRDSQAFNPSNPIGAFLRPGSGVNSLIEVYNLATSFPSLPPVTGATGAFLVRFKFRRPFVYNGPHGLAIDHFSYSTVRGDSAYVVDAERSTVDTGTAVNFGASCPAGANRANVIPTNPGGAPFSMLLFDGPPQSVGFALLGGSKTNWGPIPLPLALAGFGLGGCSLYVSMDVILPVATFSNGSASATFDIPADPALAGARVFTQWMVIDRRVNPSFPLAFSNATDVTLGKTVGKVGLAASFIYGVGNLARQRFGLVDKGISLVTQITYQ